MVASIYLIVGTKFADNGLSLLNEQLSKYGLIADPTEEDKNFERQYNPQNIRRLPDPVGTQRFDYIRLREEDSIRNIIIGHILDIRPSSGGIGPASTCNQYYPASANLEKIAETKQQLKEKLPDAEVYAAYAYPDDVNDFIFQQKLAETFLY